MPRRRYERRADLAKKVKNLRKKLRQIEELEERLGEGLSLNDEQTGKMIKPKVELELQTLEALVGASCGSARRAQRCGAGRTRRENQAQEETPPLDAGRLPQPRRRGGRVR